MSKMDTNKVVKEESWSRFTENNGPFWIHEKQHTRIAVDSESHFYSPFQEKWFAKSHLIHGHYGNHDL